MFLNKQITKKAFFFAFVGLLAIGCSEDQAPDLGVEEGQELTSQEMETILKKYRTSPNTSSTWSSIKSDAKDVLDDLFRKGAFQGQTASKAYFVKIGLRETMTQVDVNQGRMILELGFAPLKPAEFIILRTQNK